MTDTAVNANTFNTQATAYQNPYSFMNTGMAHDFFGSQIFGDSNYTPQKSKADVSFLSNAPQNRAQEVLHQFCASQGVTAAGSAPSPQAYFQASQIASMFSNNNQLMPQNSFIKNDAFAQSLFA